MDLHLVSYYIGILIVFVTHVYMLLDKPSTTVLWHSVINIVAALMIAYYFMNKEGFIQF